MCQLNVVAMVMEAFADIIMLGFCLLCTLHECEALCLSAGWALIGSHSVCSYFVVVLTVCVQCGLSVLKCTCHTFIQGWLLIHQTSLFTILGWSLGTWFKQAGWLTRGIRSFRVKAINHCISVDQFKLGLLYAAYIRGLDCLPPAPTAIKKRGQCPVSICLSYKGMDPYIWRHWQKTSTRSTDDPRW